MTCMNIFLGKKSKRIESSVELDTINIHTYIIEGLLKKRVWVVQNLAFALLGISATYFVIFDPTHFIGACVTPETHPIKPNIHTGQLSPIALVSSGSSGFFYLWCASHSQSPACWTLHANIERLNSLSAEI